MTPADTILQQLGGRSRLGAMIGARYFYSTGNGKTLGFRFHGCKHCNHCKVTLNERDLYDVEFIKLGSKRNNFQPQSLHTATDVGADKLLGVFEEFTQLYLSLWTMKA